MSAPGAPAATAGGDAAQGEGQQGEAQQQNGGGQDTAVVEQLQQLAQGQEELRQFLQAEPWQRPEQPDEQSQQADPIDLSFLDQQGFDQDTISQLGGLFQQYAEQVADQRIQQALSPIQQELQGQQWAHLASEFPELEKSDAANALRDAVYQVVDSAGWPEALKDDPRFWKMIHVNMRGIEAAQQEEGAESPEAAHLEGGGGAVPAGGQQVDFLKMITAGDDSGGLGRNVLP